MVLSSVVLSSTVLFSVAFSLVTSLGALSSAIFSMSPSSPAFFDPALFASTLRKSRGLLSHSLTILSLPCSICCAFQRFAWSNTSLT
ncbi:uncharacterized protein BKA78DRAFT_325950 [Phyllosticta capitalensis]|uniref:uncharacterized protein n=1 Tax=Phyllosticta capitalensis TaxID=121624 RepID=UPI003130242F